jgi:hypothetical protein
LIQTAAGQLVLCQNQTEQIAHDVNELQRGSRTSFADNVSPLATLRCHS